MFLASLITGTLLELLDGLALAGQRRLLRRLELSVGHGLLHRLPQHLGRTERHSQLLHWFQFLWHPFGYG